MIILYKMNSNYQIVFWSVCVKDCTVEVRWGNMLNTSLGPQLPSTNSALFSHETFETPEQAEAKMNSLAREKVGRKGYSTDIPKNVPILPMLAQDYDKHLPFTKVAIQPKLDGFRCIATNGSLKSRLNTFIRSVPHIQEALQSLPEGVKLDGELYIHGCDLQTISSYVKRDKPHVLGHLIEYHVFDMVTMDTSFEERYNDLTELGIYNAKIKLVQTEFVDFSIKPPQGQEPIEESTYLKIKHDYFARQGFEGLIIRNAESVYELNKRSRNLLKYKQFVDGEFQIVNVEEGKEACAVLVVKTGSTTTDVALKATKLRKQQILHNRENFIGRWAKVKYQKVLPSGKLFQPTCIDIYKKAEDAK